MQEKKGKILNSLIRRRGSKYQRYEIKVYNHQRRDKRFRETKRKLGNPLLSRIGKTKMLHKNTMNLRKQELKTAKQSLF